jgi:hypothetical protein
VTRAVRAYRRDGRRFAEGPEGLLVEPSTGVLWECREEGLVAGGDRGGGPSLTRLPGHRAFWFGWYAFFPETEVYAGCAADGAEER